MKHKDCVIFPRQASAEARNSIIIDNGIVRILGISQSEVSAVIQDGRIVR